MEVWLRACRILLLFSALLLQWFQCGDFTIADDKLATREEAEANFMEWVRMVGERQQSISAQESLADTKPELAAPTSGSVITVGLGESIQAAVDKIPKHNTQRVVIQLSAGTYTEQVFIPKVKPYVTLLGAGSGSTVIEWDATQSSSGGSTQDSATFGVNSPYFIAKGVTFKNSAPAAKPGAQGGQAVAFRINGDYGALYGCSFIGGQDTLYDAHGRHYFEDCYIEGTIDFIFGDGQSLYSGCTLKALGRNPGSLTAQKRESGSSSTGFSFVRCTVTGSGMVYLGRAWGPYSRVVFAYTYMDDIVLPEGWYNWGSSGRESTVFYGQYQCTGPGASEGGRVGWSHELTASQAAPFLTTSFIDGGSWL